MLAYKKYVTIKKEGNLTLNDLPFRPGQRVEVLIIAEEEERKKRLRDLRALLKKTQKLPKVKAVSDAMIAEEIAAYRAGR